MWLMVACCRVLVVVLRDPQIADRNPTVNTNEARLTAIPFFADQLTAFEVWLQFSWNEGKPPEQLPVVLQVRTGTKLLLVN